MRHTETLCPCGVPVHDVPLCGHCEQTLWDLLTALVPAVPLRLVDGAGRPLPSGPGRQPSSRWDTPLAETGALPRLLEESVGGQAVFGASVGKVDTGKAGSRTPLPSRSGDSAARLHAVVLTAADMLIDGAACVAPLSRDVATTTAAGWLLDGFTRLRVAPWVTDLLPELQRAVEAARTAVDRPPERHYLGPCPTDPCAGDLYAVEARDAVCTTCGLRVDADERRAQLNDAAAGLLLTAIEIERLTAAIGERVSAKTIGTWANRGRLEAHGSDPRRYLLSDVRVEMTRSQERRRPAS